jgi:hypothetical protein
LNPDQIGNTTTPLTTIGNLTSTTTMQRFDR